MWISYYFLLMTVGSGDDQTQPISSNLVHGTLRILSI